MNNLNNSTSEELMEMYAASNTQAFEILYQRHSGKIFGYLMNKLKNTELAQDLLQLFFQNLHKARATYNSQYKLEAWFFTIAHNLITSQYRKMARERVMLGELATFPPVGGDCENELDLSAIQKAIVMLPGNQQEVLMGRYFRGESFKYMAERLNKKEANIRKLVSRATHKIKEILGHEKF